MDRNPNRKQIIRLCSQRHLCRLWDGGGGGGGAVCRVRITYFNILMGKMKKINNKWTIK